MRRLTLRREALTELTTAELTAVAAGGADASGLTCPVRDCLQSDFSDLASCDSCLPTCYCHTWAC